ncbi:hypothetical protein HAX54_037754 [Datura stramonium]|uniref:Uncharacterized protein n=1 Tax=Datura stramonium TaxID=4076 RepID=A0ABS8VMS7_DATST|nr:hypothetical protein [Datura stramonium]
MRVGWSTSVACCSVQCATDGGQRRAVEKKGEERFWCFGSKTEVEDYIMDEQDMTIKPSNVTKFNNHYYATVVYAKCTINVRKDLSGIVWPTSSINIDAPWCIGGDFNIIMDINEKSKEA